MEETVKLNSTSGFSRMEKLVEEMLQQTPMISLQLVEQLRESLTNIPSKLSTDENLQAWKLSYSIWNCCVDIANNLPFGVELDRNHAMVRQFASDLLFLARDIEGVDSKFLKIASFFHRTGVIWHQLRTFEMAAVCFEKATELTSTFQDGQDGNRTRRSRDDHEFMFELFVARSKTAWELSNREIACSLLGRARGLLVVLPQHHLQLAEQYFEYGKGLLGKEDAESKADSIKYLEQAYEICSSDTTTEEPSQKGIVDSCKLKILRYLAAGHLQMENYESVLKCLLVLKSGHDHPSTSYLAVKALAGLERFEEAEKELLALVSKPEVNLEACMSAIEILLKDPKRLEAGKLAFLSLQSRHPSDKGLPVRMLEYLLRRLPYLDLNNEKGLQVVLSIATNEDILKTICVENGVHNRGHASTKEQDCVHALLWNNGSEQFFAKHYETCIKLFEASMLYLPRHMDHNMQRAKCLRVLCLCRLALEQYDRAYEYITEAEKIDPNIACSFLKLKIYLQTSKEVEAIEQVETMLHCADFESEYLSLASHEAMACSCQKVAICALLKYIGLPSEKRSKGAKEVVVIRNIVNIALQDPSHPEEVLKHLKSAQSRLAEVGSDDFFGLGPLGQQEANWFASTSWNLGLRKVKTQEWQSAADFFSCASDFYGSLPESQETLPQLQRSLLLATSSLLASNSGDDCIRSASRMLDKCRKVHRALAVTKDTSQKSDDNSAIHLNLLAFDLKSRTKDNKAQLDILYHCSSLQGFKPDHYFMLASQASKNSGESTEVVNTAYRLALKLILSSPSPDYEEVAKILRKLITLADQHCKDGPAVLAVYKQAKDILASLDNHNEYPSNELQWLVATSWNRAGLHVKFMRFSEAEPWMELALDLAHYVPEMESRKLSMGEALKQVRLQKPSPLAETN